MSQRGGGLRGKYKGGGRWRQSPYNRGPGGGSGGGYRKFQRNDDGEKSLTETTPESGASASVGGQPQQPVPLLGKEKAEALKTPPHSLPVSRENAGSSASCAAGTFGGSSHTPSQPITAVTEDVGGRGWKGKKYSVKARLFVGNLPRDTTQDTVKQMFEAFGEVKEVFVQREKNFGFVRMVSGYS